MYAPVFFSQRVLSTINALPDNDRKAIASAVANEFILGADASSALTPIQAIVLTIIRQYVQHDTDNINSVK